MRDHESSMPKSGWRAFARYSLYNDSHDLFVAYRDRDGVTFALRPLELAATGDLPADAPALGAARGWTIDGLSDVRGFLQAMVEVAWDMGIRPTRLNEYGNELTAVRAHLEDMRRLAKVPGLGGPK